ncbi:MAG: N-acetylglucosamine-6-phosphate deacetylase [Cyanobacteria bacterium P01_D01_bin.1]
MADRQVIVNARLPQRPGLYKIAIEAGRINAITPQTEVITPQANQPGSLSTFTNVTDIKGDWVSLGAIDLQINGALGLAFPDLRVTQLDQLQDICELLWQQGISGFCPTIVTTSLENLHGSLAAIKTFQQQRRQQPRPNSAALLGAHLEGPFLNHAKRGAHPAQYLQPLTLAALKAVVGEFVDTISIITLAPEQAEAGVIHWLTEQNITVSLGHSLATEEQASVAFSQGATMVTHAFNAMPAHHHREPGLLGAALADPKVHCGFIADGQHICKTMLDLLLRVGRGQKGQTTDGLFLVSDALSPLGLSDGVYPWDSRQINVVEGTARLPDGTLSGTTLPLIAGAQNLVRWGLCSVQEAITLVTTHPRRAIRLPDIEVHQPAQLLRWSQSGNQLHWQHL